MVRLLMVMGQERFKIQEMEATSIAPESGQIGMIKVFEGL